MGFLPAMTCQTHGISRTAPVRWRSFEAMCGVFWEAEGRAGATGYYSSPDPRVMLFFNDVSDQIRLSEQGAADQGHARPLLRALYVPAGMPIWTRFVAGHRFSHLDLHLHRSWLLARLGAGLGAGDAMRVASQPAELQEVSALAAIGAALRQEIIAPERHPIFAESLAVALVTGLLDMPGAPPPETRHSGGLTPEQMRRLQRLLEEDGSGRLSTAALAEAVGLSPGWFSQAFKKTTGKTPLQWQQERRIAGVKQALLASDMVIADVAMQFGFADQAHLTRAFRRHEGTTPSAWLRAQRKG